MKIQVINKDLKTLKGTIEVSEINQSLILDEIVKLGLIEDGLDRQRYSLMVSGSTDTEGLLWILYEVYSGVFSPAFQLIVED